MRILIASASYELYLAKCHEALRTGLRRLFDTKCFGKGYPGYRPFLRSYDQIVRRTFGEVPDVLLADSYYPQDKTGFRYSGFSSLDCLKGFVLGDYWDVTERSEPRGFVDFVVGTRADFILSYFPQPVDFFAGSAIADRFIHCPPCFDPAIFNDWEQPKVHDVGFLASGTVDYSDWYPERHAIHKLLLQRRDLKYLWAPHPGWQIHKKQRALVGSNFSKAINSCKIFITTGGRLRNAQPKIFEALASRTLLMVDDVVGAEALGLEDSVNCVKISRSDIMDKIDHYIRHADERESIAEAGYLHAMRHHSCYARALSVGEALMARLPRKVAE